MPSPPEVFRAQSDERHGAARASSFGTHLAKQNADPLDEKAFRTVLDNGAYPGTLKRDDAIAELMKLYMRQQLGTLPAAVARN